MRGFGKRHFLRWYWHRNRSFLRGRRGASRTGDALTLADVSPGGSARVVGFAPGIPARRLAQLQAYGLVRGIVARVEQHFPVTVIQIEHTELALENTLARYIQVTPET